MHPKSVLDNFQYYRGTALDCKICEWYNSGVFTKVSRYERSLHAAVLALPPDLALDFHDIKRRRIQDVKLEMFDSTSGLDQALITTKEKNR